MCMAIDAVCHGSSPCMGVFFFFCYVLLKLSRSSWIKPYFYDYFGKLQLFCLKLSYFSSNSFTIRIYVRLEINTTAGLDITVRFNGYIRIFSTNDVIYFITSDPVYLITTTTNDSVVNMLLPFNWIAQPCSFPNTISNLITLDFKFKSINTLTTMSGG